MNRVARFMHMGLLAIAAGSWGLEFNARADATPLFETVDQIAVVKICGPLMSHRNWLWDDYDSIKGRVAAALESPCKAVVLRIDSPGGDALGVFDAAREIRALAVASGKPLFAYADGMAASAAYALACAAQAIYVPSAGFVGSVGVMRPMMDAVAADRAMGLNFAVIASGARKLDSNPHVPISESAIAETQAQVDSLAELFFAFVAEMRGTPADYVRGLEAAVFHGEKAVSAKLADGVSTFNELIAMVAGGQANALGASAETKTMNYKELRAKLRADLAKMAEGSGDDADKAKKALAAMDEEDKPAPAPEKKEEKAAVPPEKEAKAEEPPAPAPEKKDDDKEGASAQVSLAAKVHSLETKIAAKEEAETRAKLLASRPDFSATVRATLGNPKITPLSVLEDAVKNWERGPVPTTTADLAAAASVQGTRGETQDGRSPQLPPEQKKELDERMGIAPRASAMRREGRHAYFGAMTSDEARRAVSEKAAKATNGGAR